ncbi:MAG TPA: hypothetical protein VGO58_04160, partial [Chitinophagaceae bacterium]|nr:hypothetical protein [Chitinophagaceae bacterium]
MNTAAFFKRGLLCLLVYFLTVHPNIFGQRPDTIAISADDINTNVLKPGTYCWLNYVTSVKDNIKRNFVFWTLTIEAASYQDKPALGIRQLIEFKDTIYESSYSLFDQKTFTPLTHMSETSARKMNIDFTKKTIGLNGKLLNADDTARRSRMMLKGLDTATISFTMNYHADLVTFPLLPYKNNRTFLINFYEPGSPAVEQVAFTVTGGAQLNSFDNGSHECWVLQSKNKFSEQLFWISKRT